MKRNIRRVYNAKPIVAMKVRILPAGGTFETLGRSNYSEKHLNELPDGRWELRAYNFEEQKVGEQIYGRENASTAQIKALLQEKYASGKVNPRGHVIYLRTPVQKNVQKVRPAKDVSRLDALAVGELE